MYQQAENEPLLHAAAVDDDVTAIKRLIQDNYDVNEFWDCETPLHIACRLGHNDVAKTLIKQGKAKLNILTQYRHESPMYLAVAQGHYSLVQLLVENGAHIHGDKGSGSAAIQAACRYGCVKILTYLIQQSMDINQDIGDGHTALNVASHYGHIDCVKVLLQAGSDVNKIDKGGQSALYIAVMYQHPRIVKLLVALGADVNLYDVEFQCCCLHAAVNSGHLEIVTLLLAGNCDVNVLQDQGQTSLYIAAELGYITIMNALINAGADPDIETFDTENTPIFAAIEKTLLSSYVNAQKCSRESVLHLVQAGCDVNFANKAGQTPLQAALDRQQCGVALLLLAADCSLHSEYWFTSEMDFYIISLENDCPQLYTTFMHELKNPRSLNRLCRAFLRDELASKLPYSKTISKLPLPKSVQSFLLYKDIT